MSKPLPPSRWRLVNLRRVRIQQRMTLHDLAAKAGVTHATISRLELLREAAYPITAERIAAALGVEASELLGEEEPPDAVSSEGATAHADPAV